MKKAAARSGERLGAHVSTQGGVQCAPARGTAIGASAIQIFTKTPNQWKEPVLTAESATAYRDALTGSGVRAVVAHDSYLINLASPDPVLKARSIESFVAELTRCEMLGIDAVVSHPGNYMDDREAGIHRNADGLARCLERVPGTVRVLLETTAGTGTALGSSFEELARIRELIPLPFRARVGFCLDTCHVHAAGYDLAGDYDGVWARWQAVAGLEHLGCIHLNDSKTPLGSRRDRHELIGEGSLGPEPFRRIMTDPRFAGIVKVLETPKGDDPVRQDRRMLRRLRGYAR